MTEKQKDGWNDLYGREREKYYNRNGWGVVAIDNMVREERNLIKELRKREWDIQMKSEDSRIRQARYNTYYKEIGAIASMPIYLLLGSNILGNLKKNKGVNALIRLRCGNMEEYIKYWLEEDKRKCVFW